MSWNGVTLAPGTRVWLTVGRTDMRKGFDGLSTLVQEKRRSWRRLRPAPTVLVPRPARRSVEGAVTRRARPMPVCQAAGEGSLALASRPRGDGRRQGGDQPDATGHAARRDRLADAAAEWAATAGGLILRRRSDDQRIITRVTTAAASTQIKAVRRGTERRTSMRVKNLVLAISGPSTGPCGRPLVRACHEFTIACAGQRDDPDRNLANAG
jgi:hypothetical protein